MNENAKKWVAALRSGKYKQGQLFLHKGDTYCCLGVACELAVADGVQLKQNFAPIDPTAIAYDDSYGLLPLKVLDWLQLRTGEGEFHINENEWHTLTGFNDTGRSFSEIADIIESEPQYLFRT